MRLTVQLFFFNLTQLIIPIKCTAMKTQKPNKNLAGGTQGAIEIQENLNGSILLCYRLYNGCIVVPVLVSFPLCVPVWHVCVYQRPSGTGECQAIMPICSHARDLSLPMWTDKRRHKTQFYSQGALDFLSCTFFILVTSFVPRCPGHKAIMHKTIFHSTPSYYPF